MKYLKVYQITGVNGAERPIPKQFGRKYKIHRHINPYHLAM